MVQDNVQSVDPRARGSVKSAFARVARRGLAGFNHKIHNFIRDVDFFQYLCIR